MTFIKNTAPQSTTIAKPKTNPVLVGHKEKFGQKKTMVELIHALKDLTKAVNTLGGNNL